MTSPLPFTLTESLLLSIPACNVQY